MSTTTAGHARAHRRRAVGLTVTALVAGAAFTSGAARADATPQHRPLERDVARHTPPPGDGSLIWEWNETAMDVLTPSGRPLLTQPFVVAAMHVAMYDAVMAIERLRRAVRHGDLGTARRVGRGRRGDRRPPRARRLPAGERRRVRRRPRRVAGGDPRRRRPRPTASPSARPPAGARSPTASSDGTQSGPLPPMLPPGPGRVGTDAAEHRRAGAVAGDRRAVHDAVAGPVPPGTAAGARLRPLPPRPRRGPPPRRRRRRRSARPSETEIARFWADQPIAQGQRTLRAKAAAARLGPRGHGPPVRRRDDVAGRRDHRLLGRQVHVPVLAAVAVGARSSSPAGRRCWRRRTTPSSRRRTAA